jgi:uncharacterized protein YbjQ (UPF0145 family)
MVVAMLFAFATSGCSATSSSAAVDPSSPAWEGGAILVSTAEIPAGIEYKVMGSVQANARAGYKSATTLYPLLAAEARKIGGNAVVNVKKARRVKMLSWAAAEVSGIAVRVDDPQMLKDMPGSYH